MSTLARAQIEQLIPHAGTMCLWDEVVAHDAETVHCRSDSHRRPGNPLAREGRLAAVHLVEYGAQAMAIHGGLAALAGGGAAQPGVLASVRDARLSVEFLEGLDGPLNGHARRLVSNPGGAMYEFEIRCGERSLAQARVSVIYLSG